MASMKGKAAEIIISIARGEKMTTIIKNGTEEGKSVKSIFDGFDAIIDKSLGLKPGEHVKQITTCRQLCNSPPATFEPAIFSDLFDQIEANFDQSVKNWRQQPNRKPTPSKKNWDYRRKTYIGDHNPSQEMILERAIVNLAEASDDLPGWFNAMPVISGLLNGRSSKKMAVDLVHVTGEIVEMIELKWASNTPLSAMFQILEYGLALLLSRKNAEKLGYCGRHIMKAKTVMLIVLAPARFYCNHQYNHEGLQRLSDMMNDGLKCLSSKHKSFPELSFEFRQFPDNFVSLPFHCGAEVKAREPAAEKQLLAAINNIHPIGKAAG